MSIGSVSRRYKKILEENNRNHVNTKELVLKEKVYQLVKNGLSFEEISSNLEISPYVARRLYDEICKEKPKIDINDVEKIIFNLREEKLSYGQIKEKLQKLGIEKEYEAIKYTCNKIYQIKGMEEPTVDRSSTVKRTEKSQETDEKIYSLKEQGLSYLKISKILTADGEKMTRERVAQRYRRVSRLTKEQLAKSIINLVATRNATVEQIEQIAELYEVDLEEVLSTNNHKEKEEGRV